MESLVKFPNRLATAWERMGPATQKLTVDTAKAWNREMNLPGVPRIGDARTGEKSNPKAAKAHAAK